MTRYEAINILLIHSAHWTRLIEEKICGMKEGKEAVQAMDLAIEALEQEPCEDCISRQAAIDLVADYDLSMGQVVKGIHALPSVTPQPKMGRWIKTIGENGVTSAVRCSKCGFEDNRYMLFKYCPNCGQPKMQEVEEWAE